MVGQETILKVLDNSGALTAKVFRILKRRVGVVGSMVLVSIKTFKTGKKVSKGEVYKGVVICTRNSIRRDSGHYLSFNCNGVVLWRRKEDAPVGTRIRSKVPLELRFLGHLKILLLAEGTFSKI